MKFRKKPIEIEAIQWDGFNHEEIKQFVGEACVVGISDGEYKAGIGPIIVYMHIDTLEGSMQVKKGDWVIKGVNDEFYPCKPDIFEKTYERVLE